MTSLYIHIPFCKRKCFYCSFAVVVSQEHKSDSYLHCLSREAERYRHAELKTIYIGGGTPSLLREDSLRTMMGMVRSKFDCSHVVEWSIEANPEDIDLKKARLLLDLGFNRISLGVQSFNDRYLKYLGRCHSVQTARQAFDDLRQAGFCDINIDLMYSFPGQTRKEIEEDVSSLIALQSEHVSLYTLTIEKNSKFFVQNLEQQENHKQAEYYEAVVHLLENAGFHQYEISNFSKQGRESQHNLNYWTGGDYIGLGVSAHSHQEGRRSWNVSRFYEYMTRMKNGISPQEGEEKLSREKRLQESLLFGLRMNAGVNVKQLEEKFKCLLPEETKRKIAEFVQGGWLTCENNCLKTTLKGRLVLDELSGYLV